MLVDNSYLLIDISDEILEEINKKILYGAPKKAKKNYLNMICNQVSSEAVIHIYDSDITKPTQQKWH